MTSTIATGEPTASAHSTWDQNIDARYEEEMPGAVRLAYLLTGQQALAEDLAQDAFLRVASRIRRLRDPAAFRRYLRRAVVNASNSHFRHERIVRQHLESEGAEPRRDVDPADVGTHDALTEALDHLPPRQRTAIVCRYYLDLSERETARVLGVRTGTVKSSVSRGLAALREHLGEQEETDA